MIQREIQDAFKPGVITKNNANSNALNKQKIKMIKKRKPIVAALLSLLMPGLGHIYVGELKKGLILVGIGYSVILILGLLGFISTFYGIATLIIFTAGVYVFSIIDSARIAILKKEYQLLSYNKWYWYLAVFIVISVLANILLAFRGEVLGYQTYRIPAKSMVPTLQIGDFITVDTRYSQPEVGDVIVFLYPNDQLIPYVKRIAAIGGDTVAIKNGIVIRNGKAENLLSVPEDKRLEGFSTSMDEKEIPHDQLFVLGDWRDQSNDSRSWGTVPIHNVVGKVTYIWFSKDKNRIGTSVR